MENLVITDFLATNRIYYECLRSFLTSESLRNQRMHTIITNFLNRRRNRNVGTSFTSPSRRTTSTNTQGLSDILNNVSINKYSDISTNSLICPISREDFTNNDIVMQINHCRHVFKWKHLLRWFETHSTCPSCRHNLLPQINNISLSTTPPIQSNNQILSAITESISFFPEL